jgi:peptidoglycan/LPS O-acetylase OafA/YrhL
MSSRGNNIPALDGIRGLAIIFVLFHHFEGIIPASNSAIYSAKLLFSFGWVGVDLFFVLSGFLITGILLDTRSANNYFTAFYARRILRIFPLYYSVLTLVLITAAFIHPRPPHVPWVADQKLYYFYLSNWLVLWKGPWRSNVLGHFWSLAVEEQFYLLWPFCVWLLVRRNLAKLAVSGSVIALLVRIFWVAHSGPDQAIVLATVTRMDSLLCGALGAILFRNLQALNALRKWLPWAASFTLLPFAVAAGTLRVLHGAEGELFFVETIGFSLLAVGFSSLIVCAAATDGAPTLMQHLLRSRVLTDFGKYSYGIYVYHVPILGVFVLAMHTASFRSVIGDFWFRALCVVLLFATSFFVAKVSYECFERHFLALKHYFEAQRSVTLTMGEGQSKFSTGTKPQSATPAWKSVDLQ